MRKILRAGVTPGEAVRNLTKNLEALVRLGTAEQAGEAAQNKVADDLAQLRFMLVGDTETPATPESQEKICRKFLTTSNGPEGTLFIRALTHITLYPSDAQKEVATICNYIIRRCNENGFKDVFQRDYELLIVLVLQRYRMSDHPRLQIQMSSILREMMKDEELHTSLINNGEVMSILFEFVQCVNFDVSSDAFTTLKSLLTKNKKTVSVYLDANYTAFFDQYNGLIGSDNYVTRRQSLKLLGDVLLDKENKKIMMNYIGDKQNLKLLMNILRDRSKAITFEAFHVFKVFVANPHQKPEVYKTLHANREKLIAFLQNFQETERQDDSQFMHEKTLLINKLTRMTKTPQEYEAEYLKKESSKGGRKRAARERN